MIEFTTGDILRDESESIVNTVNCVGVMGRGIALQFKKAYPGNFKAYAAACKREDVKPGRMFVFDTGRVVPPRYIINFPTKRHWRGKSRIEDIEAGLNDLARVFQERRIRSVALPPLGSGLGGLDWSDVRALIEERLSGLEGVRVRIYEPGYQPATDRPVRNKAVPKMTEGRAALVGLMDRYLAGLLDPFVSLLEVHKLMYFMQRAGQPLRLRYAKGPYGPYAENLRHVLHAVEGHLISGYADGGDAPGKLLWLVPGAREDAAAFLESKPETLEHFGRVTALIEGFESSYGLELLATVDWLAQDVQVCTHEELVAQVHGWSARKTQFTPRQIGIAAGVLAAQGWIAAPARA
jgi:O-acetyl-ADP-ribose deacetylase (regulator of RNase III)